jgi:hypothetical protein
MFLKKRSAGTGPFGNDGRAGYERDHNVELRDDPNFGKHRKTYTGITQPENRFRTPNASVFAPSKLTYSGPEFRNS